MAHLFTSIAARLATSFAGGSNTGSSLNHAISQFVRDPSVLLRQPHQQQWSAVAALIAAAILLSLRAAFTKTTGRGGYCSRAVPTAVTALVVSAMAYTAKVHFGSYKYFINTNDPDSIRSVAVGVLLLQLVVRVLLDYRRTYAHGGGGGFSSRPVVLFGSAFERFESSGDNVHQHGQRHRRWRRRRADSDNSNNSSSSAPSLGKERKRPRLETYPASLPASGGADARRGRKGGEARRQDLPPPFDVSCGVDALTPSTQPPLNEERDRGSGVESIPQKDIIRGGGGVADTRGEVPESVSQGSLLANSEPPLSAERRKWRQRVLWGEGDGCRGSGGDYYRTWADASKKQSLGKSGSGRGSYPPSGGTEGAGAEENSLAATAFIPNRTGQTDRWIFVLPAWCRNLLGTGHHTRANLTPPPPTDSQPRSSTTYLHSPCPLVKSSGGLGHPKAGSGDSVMTGSSPEGSENKDWKRKRAENGSGEGKGNMAPSRSPRRTLLVITPPTRQETDMPMLTRTRVGARPGVQRASKEKRRRRKETEEDAGEGDDECSD